MRGRWTRRNRRAFSNPQLIATTARLWLSLAAVHGDFCRQASPDGSRKLFMDVMTKKLSVLIADDHETVREGLRLILDAQPDMEVVGIASDGADAVAQAGTRNPDVIVMDISMPGVNGWAATMQIADRCPTAKVVTLTRHLDTSHFRQLVEAGASGYVLKQS